MKSRLFMMLIFTLIAASVAVQAQMIKRTDAVWARTTTGTITLDGRLTEAAWASAESLRVQAGKDAGMPGSGWNWEGDTRLPLDPTDATLKFLAKGDSLYVAVICRDKSIGAGLFNQFDGLLMNLRYRDATGFAGNPYRNRMNQANEIFYGWVTEPWADPNTANVGAKPAHLADWFSPISAPRPDSLKAYWDAVTYVQGTTNTDATPDTMWSTELKFNLKRFNYNVTAPTGDVVMWGISIYDADYRWPVDSAKVSDYRVWLQSPWGNGSNFNHLRIFIRPDVGTTGTVPVIGPDYAIPDGKNLPTPVINGTLTEQVWKTAPSIRLKYGDNAVRSAYANTAKYRSGQFQPTVSGAKNPVTNANTADVKYFFKGDSLFLGFDVSDRFVQSVFDFDRYDGFRITMEQRDVRNGDSTLAKRRFTFRVDSAGATRREEDLGKAGWDSLAQAVTVRIALKGGTTVDTLGTQADSGYTAEMKIDLRKMGYPAGRGDGVVFLGITHFDGDSFAGGSYGTRVWFMRENDADDGAAWFYMDPAAVVTDVADAETQPQEFALLGNYPNPFNPSTEIRFQMARAGDVTLDVYDIAGRLVRSQALGVRPAGQHAVTFDAANLATGSYVYRLRNAEGMTLVGKMMLLK